jgi:hypothetical protein
MSKSKIPACGRQANIKTQNFYSLGFDRLFKKTSCRHSERSEESKFLDTQRVTRFFVALAPQNDKFSVSKQTVDI